MLANTKAWAVLGALWLVLGGDAHATQAGSSRLLVHQQRYTEAGREIDADLARKPSDPGALAARADLLLARGGRDAPSAAQVQAEHCVAANPDNSLCAEALGRALAAQARAGGLIAVVRHAHPTRDAFERALRLDPSNYRARVALLRFYLDTPFFLGGSGRRARELGSEAQRTDPDLARLMRAMCAFDEGKLLDAEQVIMAADLFDYVLVDDRQRDLLWALAQTHFKAGRLADSVRLFEELGRRVPSSEQGAYGLALVARAQGRLDEAAMHLAKAVSIAPRPHVYRVLGDVHAARRDRPRAIAAYRAALAAIPPLDHSEQRQVTQQLASLQGR